MKKTLYLFGCFILLIGLTQCSPKNQALDEEGFVQLFNGKNFDGWYLKIRSGNDSLAQKVFTVDEDSGWVHVFRDLPDSFELNTGKSYTHGLFYTNDSTYSRFIFKFEYKWGKKIMNNFDQFQYDAGLYYHVYDDKIWPKGVEYQVRYDHTTGLNHTGDFWASSTTFQWYAGEDGRFLLPSEGGTEQPIRGGEHLGNSNVEFNALNDKWNQCTAIVMGDKYAIHMLNGKIVNMATNLSVDHGVIGLQSETAEIFYRNIMIKTLEEDIPIEEFLK